MYENSVQTLLIRILNSDGTESHSIRTKFFIGIPVIKELIEPAMPIIKKTAILITSSLTPRSPKGNVPLTRALGFPFRGI